MTGTAFRRTGAALCLISGMALSGCSFAPDYNRPAMDIPETWSKAPYSLPMATRSLEVQWWKRFNDPVLDKLVEEALLHNQNLAAAVVVAGQQMFKDGDLFIHHRTIGLQTHCLGAQEIRLPVAGGQKRVEF